MSSNHLQTENAASIAKRLLESTEQVLQRQERVVAFDTKRDAKNLLASTRLMALVVVVSVSMGACAWAFLTSLNFVTNFRQDHRWCYFLLPVVAVSTAWVYKNHGLRSKRGNNLIIDTAFHRQLVHARMAVLTFVCSTATHLAGGSVGREGAAVQMGGTIASNVSHRFHLNHRDHHNLMLAGISSAFGGVFGAPIAGAFFGMEMCFVGKIDYTAAVYCLVASFTGNATSRLLGAHFETFELTGIPHVGPQSLVLTVLAAIAFGMVAKTFAFMVHWMKDFYARIFSNYLVAALVGSLVLLAVYAVFGAWDYAGLATWLSEKGFAGETSILDTLWKFIVTVLSLGAGFQGGEVTPLFGMGASLGGWIGQVAGVSPSFMAALGMLGVFCGGLNVPITTIMLAFDMFDGQAAAFFVITAFVSYIVSGHRGVYQAQRIVAPKRRTLAADEGSTLAEAVEQHREKLHGGVAEKPLQERADKSR